MASKNISLLNDLYITVTKIIHDYFHSTGHDRFHEHIKIADRIAQQSSAIFQNESLHGRIHKHSPSTVTSSIKKV